MTETKEPEPSGRKRQEPKEMGSDALVAAFGLATRLRAHEVDWQLDAMLQRWLGNAQEELSRVYSEAGQSLYAQGEQDAGTTATDEAATASAHANPKGTDNVVDADYEIVDDEKK